MKSKFLLLVSLVLSLNVFAQTQQCRSDRFIPVAETESTSPCRAFIKTIVSDRNNGCVFDLNIKVFNASTGLLIVEDNKVVNPSIDPIVNGSSFACVPAVRIVYTVTNVRGNCIDVSDCTNTQTTSGTPGVVLPVKLTSFDANSKNGVVSLKWTSESEISFKEYQIEMNDGTGFKNIGTVVAKNSNVSNSYNFNHNFSSRQLIQYRLKMVDIDGKFAYSNIALVKTDGQSFDFNIFPNPGSSTNTKIQIAGLASGSKIQVTDMSGRVVKNMSVSSSNIQLGDLPTGVYMVKLYSTSTAEQVTKRLVIVN